MLGDPDSHAGKARADDGERRSGRERCDPRAKEMEKQRERVESERVCQRGKSGGPVGQGSMCPVWPHLQETPELVPAQG